MIHATVCQKKKKRQKMSKYLNMQFLKEDKEMAKKHIKRCSNYMRNVNQMYNEVSLHSSKNGHHQRVYKK